MNKKLKKLALEPSAVAPDALKEILNGAHRRSIPKLCLILQMIVMRWHIRRTPRPGNAYCKDYSQVFNEITNKNSEISL
jgi:hypothetical protein